MTKGLANMVGMIYDRDYLPASPLPAYIKRSSKPPLPLGLGALP